MIRTESVTEIPLCFYSFRTHVCDIVGAAAVAAVRACPPLGTDPSTGWGSQARLLPV
jgi:hypothetical protein|eukprot:COSAG01_NODE_2429_length_7714_cov_4.250033_2_plen_57_part_00